MEEGPQDGIGEAIVMAVGDVVFEVDGLAGILLHEALVYKWAVLRRDEEARPSDPSKAE